MRIGRQIDCQSDWPKVHRQPFYIYSKALRCPFLGERKNLCSSKFVQLLLLNRVKARWSRFSLHKFVHLKFFGPYSKTCTCKVRAARGRVSQGLTVFIKFSEISNKCTPSLSINTGLKVLWTRIRKMSDIKTFRKLLNDLTKI